MIADCSYHKCVAENTTFTQGVYFVPLSAEGCQFHRCHFPQGFILRVHPKVTWTLFEDCQFDQGSLVIFEKDKMDFEFRRCNLPPCQFIQGQINVLAIVRSSTQESIDFLPPCQHLMIFDGLVENTNWELTQPLSNSPVKFVTYINKAAWENPYSLEMITTSLWENYYLSVDEMHWEGEEDQLVEFKRANNRRRRAERYILVALVSARMFDHLGGSSWVSLLPEELVKNELAKFLL